MPDMGKTHDEILRELQSLGFSIISEEITREGDETVFTRKVRLAAPLRFIQLQTRLTEEDECTQS